MRLELPFTLRNGRPYTVAVNYSPAPSETLERVWIKNEQGYGCDTLDPRFQNVFPFVLGVGFEIIARHRLGG